MNYEDPKGKSERVIETFEAIEAHARETARLTKHIRIVAVLAMLLAFGILIQLDDVIKAVAPPVSEGTTNGIQWRVIERGPGAQ